MVILTSSFPAFKIYIHLKKSVFHFKKYLKLEPSLRTTSLCFLNPPSSSRRQHLNAQPTDELNQAQWNHTGAPSLPHIWCKRVVLYSRLCSKHNLYLTLKLFLFMNLFIFALVLLFFSSFRQSNSLTLLLLMFSINSWSAESQCACWAFNVKHANRKWWVWFTLRKLPDIIRENRVIQLVLLSSSGTKQNKQVDVKMFSYWSDSRWQDGAPPPPPPPPPLRKHCYLNLLFPALSPAPHER